MPEPIDMTVFYHLESETPVAVMVVEIPLDRYRSILRSMGTKTFSQNMIDGFGAALAGHDIDIPFTERCFTIDWVGEEDE